MKQLDNLFLYPSFFVWFSYSPINGKGSIPFTTNIKKYLIKEKGCKVWKPGRAWSNEKGILCHPGWDRVTWSAKNSCQSMIYWSTLQLQTYWHKYQNLTWFGSSSMNVSTIKILPVFTNVVQKLVISCFYTNLFCCTEMRWMFISSTAIWVTD